MSLNRTIHELCKELEDKLYDTNKQIQHLSDSVEGIRNSDRKVLVQLEIEELEEKYDKLDTQRSDLLTIKTILAKFIAD